MNTLSKYDIADIVSHISGKTQGAAEQSSNGSSFADLLREAVENIPSPKAAEKVAEGGKIPPELAAVDAEGPVEGGLGQEQLQALFRQAFDTSRGHSSIELQHKNEEPSEAQRLKLGRNENSDVIEDLKAVLKFGINEDAKVTSDKGARAKVVSSPDDGNGIGDERIRVATLMEKRPVILGPGTNDDDLNTQVMTVTNLLMRSQRLLEETPNFGNSQKKPMAVEVDGVEGTLARDSLQENSMNNIPKATSLELDSISKNLVAEELEGDDSDSSNLIRASELRVAEKAYTETEMHPERRASSEIAGNVTSQQHSGRESDREIERQADFKKINLQAADKNILAKLKRDGERQIPEKKVSTHIDHEDSRSREKTFVGETRFGSESNVSKEMPKDSSLRAEPIKAEGNRKELTDIDRLAFASEPSGVDSKLGATEKARDELSPNNILRYQANADRISAQSRDLPNPVFSDKKREIVENKFRRFTADAENNDVVEKTMGKNHLKTDFEIQINETRKKIEIDRPRTASVDPNLTIKEGEPTINQRGETFENFKSEPLTNVSQERPALANKPEVLPRPVAVSNFSSEMQETIVGQLSKSSNGVSKFTVALFPENMGKISVEISYSEAAGLKINMIGDNLEATKILEQNLSTLRESLQTDKLNELIVNLNNNKDSHGSNQKQAQSDGDNFEAKEDKDTGTSKLIDTEPDVLNNDLAIDSENGLDTYV